MARRKKSGEPELFIEQSGQLRMTDKSAEQQAIEKRRVECLGMTFENDEARRAYFLEKLREKLKDPEFRKVEGFPIGKDEDILALSDPPYYTACPNPFLADFIRCYGKQYDPNTSYNKEPIAVDISERRTDIVYTAHPYHTKVPPRAIARYLLHYTSPGDIVLDAFAGSGMAGVAAGYCADNKIAKTHEGESGARHVILCDLSPAATFIASVYLNPPEADGFFVAAGRLLARADEDVGVLWTTKSGNAIAKIEFELWTEVFSCPLCQEAVASESVVKATEDIGTAKEFACPHCGGLVSKAPSKNSKASRLLRRLQTRYDTALGKTIQYVPRASLFAQVRIGSQRLRLPTAERHGSGLDSALVEGAWHPSSGLIKGERYEHKDYCHAYGITHLHHFYLPRQLVTYSALWKHAWAIAERSVRNSLIFFIQSNALGMTVLNRFGPTHYSQVSRNFSGTLYVPSMIAETSPHYTYSNKRQRLHKAFAQLNRFPSKHCITTQSATCLRAIQDCSIDYIFVDPPFGRNLQYSELNQLWEAWLRVQTHRNDEAVMDATRNRGVMEYASIMRNAFKEMHRVLKPGRWITVEFHNSSNAVWHAIQEALMSAGLVVADVRTLNKESDTYKQSRQGLVKQDLIISAYKPNGGFENRFSIEAGTEIGVWEFVRTHLSQLPVFVVKDGLGVVIEERQAYLLFDRMVSIHVQRGVTVPVSAAEFNAGLARRFILRDGMYFLPEQAIEYDKKRMTVKAVAQLELFVVDEATAIQWLRQELTKKPYPLQELTPRFMQEAQRAWAKHEQSVELREILEQNFFHYEGAGPIPMQIVSWLKCSEVFRERIRKLEAKPGAVTEAGLTTDDPALLAEAADRWYVPDPARSGDLEKFRERALLREFDEYRESKQKQLKTFRLESVRAGFKRAWQERDYATIISVAKKIPENVLQEDPKLLMWYDQAVTRTGEER
jgi:DNA modification methylase